MSFAVNNYKLVEPHCESTLSRELLLLKPARVLPRMAMLAEKFRIWLLLRYGYQLHTC